MSPRLSEALGEPAPPALGVEPARWRAVAELARRGGATAPPTSSVERLFDAVAAARGER